MHTCFYCVKAYLTCTVRIFDGLWLTAFKTFELLFCLIVFVLRIIIVEYKKKKQNEKNAYNVRRRKVLNIERNTTLNVGTKILTNCEPSFVRTSLHL